MLAVSLTWLNLHQFKALRGKLTYRLINRPGVLVKNARLYKYTCMMFTNTDFKHISIHVSANDIGFSGVIYVARL